MIKNAKFSGYYFYLNSNKWWDFQICISVPLNSLTMSTNIARKEHMKNHKENYERVKQNLKHMK